MNDQNLIPFPKGKSGNPKGRPKGSKGLTSRMKKMLKMQLRHYDPIKEEEVTQSLKNHIVDVLISKAINGEDKAIFEIFNRVDGKVKEEHKLNHSGEIGMPDLRQIFKECYGGVKPNGKAETGDPVTS